MKKFLLYSTFTAALFLFSGCGESKTTKQLSGAISAAQKQEWLQSLELVEECEKSLPANTSILTLKALALYKSDPTKLEEAIALSSQACGMETHRYDAWFVNGWLLMQAKRYPEALEPLKRAFQLHLEKENAKNVPDAVAGSLAYALGICQQKNNQNAEAIRHLELALKHNPQNEWPQIYNELAVLHMRMGNTKKAFDNARLAFEKSGKKSQWQFAVNYAICMDQYLLANLPTDKKRRTATQKQHAGIVAQWYSFSYKQLYTAMQAEKSPQKKQEMTQILNLLSKRYYTLQ